MNHSKKYVIGINEYIEKLEVVSEMIEFSGYISGAAEKHFSKKSRDLVQNALLISLLFFLPIIVFIAIKMRYALLLIVYCGMFAIIPILVRIPQGKKDRRALTPRKIVIDGSRIICVADKYTETKRLNDVKLVHDFGEFYEMIFPFGKMSEKFICQKDLLTKGSLGEFEKLFKGKIQKTQRTVPCLVSCKISLWRIGMGMKSIKINCKVSLWLWFVTYAIMCVLLNIYIESPTHIVPLGHTYMEIATPECALLIIGLVLIWFLPLAVVTYYNTGETHKKIRFISRCIIFWLILSLFACFLILIFSF